MKFEFLNIDSRYFEVLFQQSNNVNAPMTLCPILADTSITVGTNAQVNLKKPFYFIFKPTQTKPFRHLYGMLNESVDIDLVKMEDKLQVKETG